MVSTNNFCRLMDGPDNVSIPYRYGIYNSEVVVDKAATEEGFNSL